MKDISIQRTDNKVSVQGTIDLRTYKSLLAEVHRITNQLQYQELFISFEDCESASPGAMLAITCQLMELREAGVYTKMLLPKNTEIRRLFQNTNWAFLIDPRTYDPSKFIGKSRVPATQFKNPKEQLEVVNKTIDSILSSVSDLTRSQLNAFEWAINEVTDNVLVHSNSKAGGLIQVSLRQKDRSFVEFEVCDAGHGIPKTLRESDRNIASDADALDRAIREGVTRDKKIGQGNGLFGTYQVCALSKGDFYIHSGYANLIHERTGLHIYPETRPYSGALILGRLDFTEKNILQHALQFGGKPATHFDFVEKNYETTTDSMLFKMKNESSSMGSRISGAPIRTKLENLLKMSSGMITIDLDSVPLLSSSFADEVFGKLFVQLGPMTFSQRVRIVNVTPIVRNLIDKAIMQRMTTG